MRILIAAILVATPAIAAEPYVVSSTAATCAKAVAAVDHHAESEKASAQFAGGFIVTSGCNQNADGSWTVVYSFEPK